MRGWTRAFASFAAFAVAGTASAANPEAAAKHAAIAAYEGTRTCSGCHDRQVKEVVASLHYQHQGPTPFLANAQQGKSAGMMVSY